MNPNSAVLNLISVWNSRWQSWSRFVRRRGLENFEKNAGELEFFLFLYAAFAAFVTIRTYPGYVHQDTAEIFMWSTLGFKLGFIKHPPLLPWIVGALSKIAPINWITISLLSALNIALAAFGVWRIGCLTAGKERAILVMALYLLSPYAALNASTLNHNTILLSTWPFVIWAFLLAVRDPQIWRGVIFGLAAAVSLYAKYTSALLLFSLGVAALVSVRRADFFASPAPYAAVLTCAALFAPHVWWAAHDNWSTVAFASNQTVPIGSLPLQLLEVSMARLLPVLAGFAALYSWIGPPDKVHTRDEWMLIAIVILPYVLIVVLNIAMGLRGSQGWTMPAIALVPLVLISKLGAPSSDQRKVLIRALPYVLTLLPILGAANLAVAFALANHSIVEPRAEFARDAAAVWAKTVGRPIAIVAGDHNFAVSASVELPDHPRTWSWSWPKSADPWWITPEFVEQRGLIAICLEGSSSCRRYSEQLIAEHHGWTCSFEERRVLWGMTGPVFRVEVYYVPPSDIAEAITSTCGA